MEVVDGLAERTPRGQGELLRERLIEAALAMIDGGELNQLSIRAVTKRAGVSPNAFYLHFESRQELIDACVERSFVAFRAHVRAAGAAADARGRLLGAGRGYIDFAREQPERYGLIFGVDRRAEGPGLASNPGGGAFEDLLALVGDYLAPQRPTPERINALAKGIWAGLHGYVDLSHCRPGMDWPEPKKFVRMLASAWLEETGPDRD